MQGTILVFMWSIQNRCSARSLGFWGKDGIGVGYQAFEVFNNSGGIDDGGFACVVYIGLHNHRHLRAVARDFKIVVMGRYSCFGIWSSISIIRLS